MDSTLGVHVEILLKIQWELLANGAEHPFGKKSNPRYLFHTIHENEFKVDLTPKCDT